MSITRVISIMLQVPKLVSTTSLLRFSSTFIAEYEKRLAIFQGNLKEIKTLQESDKGTATYGVNEFADMSSKVPQRHTV